MIYRADIQQGGESWHQIRRGKFTASPKHGVPSLFMGKNTQGYNDLIYRVAMERMYGEAPDKKFNNFWTERGTALEPEARQSYEIETLTVVDEVGFVEVDDWLGCSPDGLIGDKGDIQIKCLAYNTHIGYLFKIKDDLTDNENLLALGKDYYLQVQTELWMMKRKWCDWYAYHPQLPSIRLRALPDIKVFGDIEAEIGIAKEKVIETMKKIEACRK